MGSYTLSAICNASDSYEHGLHKKLVFSGDLGNIKARINERSRSSKES